MNVLWLGRKPELLHRGEAESLALACELQPDWFVTNDAAARVIAESLQLEAHGSLGIVLCCAATHRLTSSEAEPLLTRLENSSLWMSPIVRARARSALAEMYGTGKEDD
jgi:predicted nucleic acid-binding protein